MKSTVFAIACLLTATHFYAQATYSGVLHQTEAELSFYEAQSWDSLLITEKKMTTAGYRLMELETALKGPDRYYWSIWVKSDLGHKMERINGWKSFIEQKRAKVTEGYVMGEVEGIALTDTEQQFYGVWYKGDTPHKVWRLDSQEGIQKKTVEMAAANFYLVDLDVFETPANTVQYLALYHYGLVGQRAYIVVESDLKTFNTEILQRTKSGYRIIDFEKFRENDQVHYLAVFRKGDSEAVLLRDMDKDGFYGRLDMAEQNRFQLVDIELDERPTKKGKLAAKK